MMERNTKRPIDYLKNSINQIIIIKVKRNQIYRARLIGFDEHLNLFLEETSLLFEDQDEDGNVIEDHENLGTIVMRGDNVIFISI